MAGPPSSSWDHGGCSVLVGQRYCPLSTATERAEILGLFVSCLPSFVNASHWMKPLGKRGQGGVGNVVPWDAQ